VQALQKLLAANTLTPSQRKLVIAKITEKASILEQGCRKRGKTEEADYYQRLIESFLKKSPA